MLEKLGWKWRKADWKVAAKHTKLVNRGKLKKVSSLQVTAQVWLKSFLVLLVLLVALYIAAGCSKPVPFSSCGC